MKNKYSDTFWSISFYSIHGFRGTNYIEIAEK